MFKKRKLIGITILFLLAAYGATVFTMGNRSKNENINKPFPSDTNSPTSTVESKKPDEEATKLGYAPGEILIEFKSDVADLKTDEGKRFVLEFVKKKSEELASLIVEKLVSEGKMGTTEATEQKINELKLNLITHEKDYVDENGSLLNLAISDSVMEIVDELKKSTSVKMVTPNYIGQAGAGEKIILVPQNLLGNESSRAKELGYVPGQLIIKQQGAFNVRSSEGLKKFKTFLVNESKKLTPVVLEKLVANGKLKQDNINTKLISQLEKYLITYDKYTGNGYEIYLVVAIDNAVTEVAEELAKEEEITQAHENGFGIIWD